MMNREKKTRGRQPSAVVHGLNRAAAWVYGTILRGLPGRIFTSYRRAEANFLKGHRAANRGGCRPVSERRRRLLESIEQGMLIKGLRALFRYLFTCPMNFYGLFGLFYGLLGVGIYFLPSLAGVDRTFPLSRLMICLLIAGASIPFVTSTKPLSHTLGASAFARWLLVRFLGVPKDGLTRTERQNVGILPYLALLLAVAAAVATWWIHPLVIPAVMLSIAVLGMIFAYPEVGVVLSTALLPTLLVGEQMFLLTVAVILVTWISYGIKLLFMHRTMRWGLLDVVVLVFNLLVLLSGMTGVVVTPGTVTSGILWFILLSLYFLMTNLMTTRAYVRRCFWGMTLSFPLVIAMSLAQVWPTDGLSWLSGSPAGDAIVTWVGGLFDILLNIWNEEVIIVAVLLLPFLYVRLPSGGRLIKRLWRWLLLGCAGVVIVGFGSPELWVCALVGLLLFAFLYSYRTLSVTMVAILPVSCGLWWYAEALPMQTSAFLSTLFGNLGTYRDILWQNVWRMIEDHPAGIGWGSEAFLVTYAAYADTLTATATGCGNLYLELLTAMGWQGLLLFGAVVFLFMQKSLSCMRYTGNRADRSLLLGGIVSVSSVLLMGAIRGVLHTSRVFFVFWLVLSLISAYANVVYEDCDELMAERGGDTDAQADRVIRVGL